MFNVEVRTIINNTEPSDINRASICIRVQRKVQERFSFEFKYSEEKNMRMEIIGEMKNNFFFLIS